MKLFINQCIKNREFMEFTYKDMSNCLINVSEKDYEDFELGNYEMSNENLDRLVRVLHISKIKNYDMSDYLNPDEYDEEELRDLSNVILSIVGEEND